MSYDTMTDFFTLKGQTIQSIDVGDVTRIVTDSGTYSLYHEQDCCENVYFYKLIGNVEDVLNSPITLAEDDSHSNDPDWYTEKTDYRDSYTWSVFVLETVKGKVELWFYGTSNGYYGETVSCHKE